MTQNYSVSKALVDKYTPEELQQLCNQGAVDIGWWTRFNGIDLFRGTSEEELKKFFEEDFDRLAHDWETQLQGIKKADLLYQYADGFFNGTRDLLDVFLQKEFRSDSDALPILFLFCQFAELALKASTEYFAYLRQELGKPVVKPNLNHHNLSELLSNLKALFDPQEPFLSEETQEFIVKIQSINEASQAFRFPFSNENKKKEERAFLVKAPLISMGIFKAEFDIHASELHNFVLWLSQGYVYVSQDE